jgi:hypothetical protein
MGWTKARLGDVGAPMSAKETGLPEDADVVRVDVAHSNSRMSAYAARLFGRLDRPDCGQVDHRLSRAAKFEKLDGLARSR